MSNTTDQKRFITAARAKVMLGTIHIGNARDISVSFTIRNQPTKVLGSVLPTALVPVDTDCSARVGLFHVKEDQTVGNIHQTTHDGIILTEPVDLHCMDNVDGNKVVFTVKGCMPSAKNYEISSGSIAMRNITFDAILAREPNQ